MKYKQRQIEEAKEKEAIQHLKDLQRLNTTESDYGEIAEEDIQLGNTTAADDETSPAPAINESDVEDQSKLSVSSEHQLITFAFFSVYRRIHMRLSTVVYR